MPAPLAVDREAEPLSDLRNQLGLTQKELAARIGVSRVLIRAVEGGQRPMTDDLRFRLDVLMTGRRAALDLALDRHEERLQAIVREMTLSWPT